MLTGAWCMASIYFTNWCDNDIACRHSHTKITNVKHAQTGCMYICSLYRFCFMHALVKHYWKSMLQSIAVLHLTADTDDVVMEHMLYEYR